MLMEDVDDELRKDDSKMGLGKMVLAVCFGNYKER